MTGYGIYKSIMMVLWLGFVAVAGWVTCIWFTCQEISTELTLRRDYGEGWQAAYEKYHGPLADGRVKIVMGVLGTIIIPLLVFALSRALRPEWQKTGGKMRPRRRHRGSSLDRSTRYRRNALLGICVGVGGLFAGAALVVFRWGIFAEHANEEILGIVLYAGGYLGIISGCWWWLKSKAWTQEVAFIGLMPLGILFIPFVRLILLTSPLILPLGMGMMSLILVAVVFALPDRSGHDGRGDMRSRRHRDD